MAFNVNSLEGNDLSAGDYLRKSVPQSRWGDTWDVFKSNFGKIVLINLFVLISFIPGIVIVFFRSAYISAMGSVFPFNTSIIYPFYPDMRGLNESVVLSADLMFYGALVVAGFIASVGIAGAAYSLKKLLNTHGEFSVKGFFHGVKVCYFNTVLPVTLVMLFFFGAQLIGDWRAMTVAQGNSAGGPTTAYVFIIIATVLIAIYAIWLLAVGVSYRVKLTQLIKNSFVLLIATPVQTVLMAAFIGIPVWFFMIGGFMRIISYILFIFFGFSFMLLSWMSYTQWVFDMFISPNLKAAEEQAKANKSEKQLAMEKEEEDRRVARELLAAGRSELIARPIMPISEEPAVKSFGLTFSRQSIAGAEQDRNRLAEQIAAYENEHKNDPVYAEYNKMFAEREKALQTPEGKKGKKKRVSADNLLK